MLRRLRVGLLALTAALALGATTGCSTLGYYGQAVGGHLQIVHAARPVERWLADPATPEPLRERLKLAQQMRAFAVRELALPDNNSYRRYADLGRPSVVYNVVAAPELSLELKTWCFPMVGCVGYRGYFSREPAEATAEALRAQGWETSVYGVPAYSTLGRTEWLGGDPLLNTFLFWPEGELARLLFHELAHHIVYVRDDTMFNESFAVAVERIGGRRWLQQHGTETALAEYAALEARRAQFRALTLDTRQRLQQVYTGPGSDEDKRRAKGEVMAGFRSGYETLKREAWGGFAGYDGWVARANNAAFAVQAAYDELVPGFEALYEAEGRDLPRFYAAVKTLAALPKAERRARLGAAN